MTILDVVTPKEAAQLTGLSVERIRQLLRADRLAHQVTPLGRLIERSAVDALAGRRRCGDRMAA